MPKAKGDPKKSRSLSEKMNKAKNLIEFFLYTIVNV